MQTVNYNPYPKHDPNHNITEPHHNNQQKP